MKKPTIHSAMDHLDQSYIAEGIELYERSLMPKHRKSKRFARVLLIAALFIIISSLLLFPLLFTPDPPLSSPPTSPESPLSDALESVSSKSTPASGYDPYTLIEFEILPYDGSFYLYFPESAQKILQIGSAGSGPAISEPSILPEFDDRMTFFPFESVSQMIAMFTDGTQMPLWFAEYILEHFPVSDGQILLPDFEHTAVPALPQSFRTGKAYLSGEYYCVQILSDHFTNGLFNSFGSSEEYQAHYEQFSADWSEEEGIRILKTHTEQTDDLLLSITDYLKDGLKYKRVQTTLKNDEKTIHAIAVYPFPHLGSTAPVEDEVLPQEITLYIEEDGLYGSIYLTQFGKNLTLEELFTFGIEEFKK